MKTTAWEQGRKLWLASRSFNGYSAPIQLQATSLRLALACLIGAFLASCATQPPTANRNSAKSHRMNVRTTAYCVHERGGGGRRNAVGEYLSGRIVRSAASDWSRFPLGTRFKIVETGEEYVIDDYGTALVGTNTIDLYKPTRLEMKRWGVRYVDVDILYWGSEEQSIKVLTPRAKHRTPRRMLIALASKKKSSQVADREL
ncbi:MAG TPA: 3D domain-containing protein [Chthoniobacterales bacterium]